MGREPSIQDHIVQSGIDTLIGENLRADTEDAMGQRQTPSLVEDFVNFLKNDRADYNTIQTQLQSLAPAKD